MYKLIASDVDGTLIKDSTPDLYPEIIETIKELREKGILFCAASGRQYHSLKNTFREVAEEIAYIAENGAHIRYGHENIAVTAMKREDVEGIMQMLRGYYNECSTIVSTPNGSLIECDDEDFLRMITYGYHNTFKRVKDVLAEQVPIIKVSIFHKGSIRKLGESTLIPAWQDRVKACMAGDEWVDFMEASVDKGNALKTLMEHFGIAREETMAFGDNNNDIGMMQAAGRSFAVDTAVEEVKKAATGICPGYQQKGVYQTIRQIVLD